METDFFSTVQYPIQVKILCEATTISVKPHHYSPVKELSISSPVELKMTKTDATKTVATESKKLLIIFVMSLFPRNKIVFVLHLDFRD